MCAVVEAGEGGDAGDGKRGLSGQQPLGFLDPEPEPPTAEIFAGGLLDIIFQRLVIPAHFLGDVADRLGAVQIAFRLDPSIYLFSQPIVVQRLNTNHRPTRFRLLHNGAFDDRSEAMIIDKEDADDQENGRKQQGDNAV